MMGELVVYSAAKNLPAVIKLPDVHQHYYLARKVLRDANATREQITAACDVLMCSTCWTDIVAVRKARNELFSTPASEHGANFNRRQQEDVPLPVAAAFMVVSACFSVASIIAFALQNWWLA